MICAMYSVGVGVSRTSKTESTTKSPKQPFLLFSIVVDVMINFLYLAAKGCITIAERLVLARE